MKVATNAKISSIATFCQDCGTIYERFPQFAEDEYLKPRFAHLKSRTSDLIILMKSARNSFGLSESDKARETAFRAAEQGIKGYLVLPFEEKKEAARFFSEIFTRHGSTKVLAQKYIDTSALIDSIEKDCSSDEAKAYLEKLDGLDVLFSALFQANRDFKAKFVDKESDTGLKKSAESATSVKKELVAYCNTQILPYIDAMRLSFPDKYAEFAKAIEGAVKTVNASVPKKTKASSKEAETEKNSSEATETTEKNSDKAEKTL